VVRAFSGRQLLHAGIEGHQDTAASPGMPKQRSIRPLLMPFQFCGKRRQDRRKVSIKWPEFMTLMTRQLGQNVQCCRAGQGSVGDGGIGEQAQRAQLREGIRRPAPASGLRKPGVGGGMALEPRPKQR